MEDTTPIRELYNEHNGITIMLEVIHTITGSMRRGSSVPKTDLLRIIDFLQVFADTCHHGKEEGILIPEMKKSKRSDAGLLREIIGEHKTGRDLIGGMRHALDGFRTGESEPYHFAANAEAYVTLLTNHIRKENVILFPQADEIFDMSQKKRMTEKFNALEAQVIGKGRHEAFHALLGLFRKKYL